MNQPQHPSRVSFRLVPDPNPWSDPATLPRLSRIGTLLLCLFVLVCAVYPTVAALPAATTTGAYTAAVLLLCAIVYLGVVRSLLPILAALAVFVLGAMTGGLAGGVLALSLLSAVSIGAYLICTVRSWWLLLVPVLAYLAALVPSGDALLALLSLLAFPAAGVLAYAIMRNDGRVGTICATSAVFGLCAAFGLALWWYASHGAISPDELTTLFYDVREQLILTLQESDQLDVLLQSLEQAALSERDVAELIRWSVELTFALLPAMIVTLCNVFGYAAQLICTRTFASTGKKQLMTRVSQLFVLSVPSAIVFFICSVAMLFTDTLSLGGAVMANLFLILLPGMSLVGIFKLIADARRKFSVWMLLLVVAALLFAPAFLILGLSLSGAATTLLRPLFTRMMLLSQQGKDDPSDKHDE